MGLFEASSTRRNQNRTSQYPHRDGARMRRSKYPWRELLSPWRVPDPPNQTTLPTHHHQSSVREVLVPDLEVPHPHVGPSRRSKVRAGPTNTNTPPLPRENVPPFPKFFIHLSPP